MDISEIRKKALDAAGLRVGDVKNQGGWVRFMAVIVECAVMVAYLVIVPFFIAMFAYPMASSPKMQMILVVALAVNGVLAFLKLHPTLSSRLGASGGIYVAFPALWLAVLAVRGILASTMLPGAPISGAGALYVMSLVAISAIPLAVLALPGTWRPGVRELAFAHLVAMVFVVPEYVLWSPSGTEDALGVVIFGFIWIAFQALIMSLIMSLSMDKSAKRRHQRDLNQSNEGGDIKPEVADTDFSSLYGYDQLKLDILEFAFDWKANRKKNGILLYGPPGTGKTAFANALAGELDLPIYTIGISTIKSKWLGQTTEQLKEAFARAKRHAPCVLFIDEIEAVVPPRDGERELHNDEAGTVSAFLTEVDNLRMDNEVLLIGATNFFERLDKAGVRPGRFDLRKEVGVPDQAARKGLMLDVLDKAKVKVDDEVIDRMAARWVGFNVPRLREIASTVARMAAGKPRAERGDFRAALRKVQGNAASVPENTPDFDDLYLDDAVRSRLQKLATIFGRADEIEAHGGNVSKAVLFYGPPGTGKTTMAKVLAKASGYAFIATTGGELSKPGMVEKIHARASDLRPAIIFIDEAETAIGDRAATGNHNLTNELLARIDGVKSVPDVIWVAATNHAGVVDPAMVSRFTEKVELPVPGHRVMTRLIADWAKKRSDKIVGTVDAWVAEVAALLDGAAPRDIYGALDAAWNAAVAEAVTGDRKPMLTAAHVREVYVG